MSIELGKAGMSDKPAPSIYTITLRMGHDNGLAQWLAHAIIHAGMRRVAAVVDRELARISGLRDRQ